jgi:hypothetical protein
MATTRFELRAASFELLAAPYEYNAINTTSQIQVEKRRQNYSFLAQWGRSEY